MSAKTTKGVQFDLHALSRVLYRGPERFTIKFTINQADKGRLQSFGIFSLSIEHAKLFSSILSRNTIEPKKHRDKEQRSHQEVTTLTQH